MQINLTDSRGRDAVVSTESVSTSHEIRWLGPTGSQASNRRILKGDLAHEVDALVAGSGSLEEVPAALIEGDPDVDIETFGSFLDQTSRVYLSENNELVHRLTHWDVLYDADGEETGRRPKKVEEQNISSDTPLSWTGRYIPKAEACKRFVFSQKTQITHINGLTYDFLFAMAKELAERNALLLLGAGPKGKDRLVFRRGALPYYGFLEGRVDGERYALVLHLSKMELKPPQGDGKIN